MIAPAAWRVDGGVDNDPGSTAELAVGWDVDEDGLLELDEGIDNVRAVLEDLVVHVALTARETTPVGEDHKRQLLAIVEVLNGLSSLEGRVGVPDTTGFRSDLLNGVGVGRIGRSDVLNRASLDTDDTNRDATKASTTNNDSLGPTAQTLLKRAAVEETRLEAVRIFLSSDEVPDIVGSLARWVVSDIAVPVISRRRDGNRAALLVRHVRYPLDDLGNTLEIVIGSHVRNTVPVHDLSATKLKVGSVHFTTKELVNSLSTSEDDGLAFNLDGTLSKTDKVSTNTCKPLA